MRALSAFVRVRAVWGRSAPAVSALLLAATVAGCGGSSSSSQTTGAAGPNGSGPSPNATAPSAAGQQSAAASPATTAASQASPAASSSAHRVSTGPGSKPPGKASGFTRAGTYTYALSGSSKSPLGAQDVSGTGTLAVDPPKGFSQHSTQSGKDGSQDLTVDVRSGGLYLAEIKIASQGFNEDFQPSPPVLYFPADYSQGRKWSWTATSTDGKYTLHVTSTITSTSSSVTVGGKSQHALIVDSTLHITGSGFDITTQQRDWVSTAYALVLKEHATSSGTAYGASFSSDVTRTLRSTTPS